MLQHCPPPPHKKRGEEEEEEEETKKERKGKSVAVVITFSIIWHGRTCLFHIKITVTICFFLLLLFDDWFNYKANEYEEDDQKMCRMTDALYTKVKIHR